MWWNQVHGVGVGSTSFPKTSCRRNAWNSRSVKPLALWIYSTAILTFRRIHAREFVELVWTCILIKRDEPPKSMKENGLQKIQGCAFLQFFSACDVTNWKLKRWSAHTWQILWNKVKHLFKVLHLFFFMCHRIADSGGIWMSQTLPLMRAFELLIEEFLAISWLFVQLQLDAASLIEDISDCTRGEGLRYCSWSRLGHSMAQYGYGSEHSFPIWSEASCHSICQNDGLFFRVFSFVWV